VAQAGGCPHLALRAFDELLVEAQVGRQHLDGDMTVQLWLIGTLDPCHPTPARLFEDPAGADCPAHQIHAFLSVKLRRVKRGHQRIWIFLPRTLNGPMDAQVVRAGRCRLEFECFIQAIAHQA